ncbi:hypothetical protein EPO44_07270 [bacterium]|nr:MAG: hypothetical protein EPO44_07270 [bacterium]
MKARELFKKAGIGSLALAFLLVVLNWMSTPAWAHPRHAIFVAQSQVDTVGDVEHRMAMEGRVSFDADDGTLSGSGTFVHFDNASEIPKTILSFGTWEAKEFVSLTERVGMPYGNIEARILEILVDLTTDEGEVISGVTLRIISNIDPAGLTTGEATGFKLTIPGAPFGNFEPRDPPVGLAQISAGNLP